MNILLRIGAGIIAFIVLVGGGWTWLTLTWSYSDGERAGYIQKFSRKGWLCKTWEGEIAMVTMPGAIPDRFEFSVRDEAVAVQINASAGKRVVLAYQQHKFVPSACFGESEYFVTGVRAIDDHPFAPAQGVAPAVIAAPPAQSPQATPSTQATQTVSSVASQPAIPVTVPTTPPAPGTGAPQLATPGTPPTGNPAAATPTPAATPAAPASPPGR